MNNWLKLIAVLALSLNAYAYNDTSSYQRANTPEKSPLTVEAILSSEQTKDYSTGKHDGLYTKADLSAVYSLDRKNDLRLYVSAIHQLFDGSVKTYAGKSSEFSWDLTELMYRRNSIFNEKEHGVSMDLELKNYYLLDESRRELYGFDGAFIPQFIFKKHFGRRFVVEGRVRRHFYFKNNGNDGTLNYENRLYFIPTYVLTRKLFVSTQFKYKNKIRGAKYYSGRYRSMQPQVTDELIFRPSLMFLANRSLMLEGYWESTMAQSHDGQAFKEDWEKNGVLGFSAYFTAF